MEETADQAVRTTTLPHLVQLANTDTLILKATVNKMHKYIRFFVGQVRGLSFLQFSDWLAVGH